MRSKKFRLKIDDGVKGVWKLNQLWLQIFLYSERVIKVRAIDSTQKLY